MCPTLHAVEYTFVTPGGFGAAKNLSNFAVAGPEVRYYELHVCMCGHMEGRAAQHTIFCFCDICMCGICLHFGLLVWVLALNQALP